MSQYYYNPYQNSNDFNKTQNDSERNYYETLQRAKLEKRELRKISSALGLAIIAYLVVQTVVSVLILGKPEYRALYDTSPVFQYAFCIIFVSVLSVAVPFGVVALFNRKKYRGPIVPNKPLKSSKAFAWVCVGMGCCICANFVVNFIVTVLKSAFNINLTQGETLSPDSPFACVMEIIGLAVIPALCEEFAMRCCSLQVLRNYGTGFAVFAVSVVFGLLHGNVIQFIFAFVIGLVMAYVTVQTESIVPAIFIHMCNNGMSAFQDIIKYAFGEKVSDGFLVAVFVLWIAAGVLSGIYLMSKKAFKSNAPKYNGVLTLGQRIGNFLFPGMIIPFLILILMTKSTVTIG